MHDLQKLVLQNCKFWRHQCMHAYLVCIVINLGIRIQTKQTEVYDNKRRGVSRLQYVTSPILYITSKVPCRCTFTIFPGTLSPLLRVRVTFAPFTQRGARSASLRAPDAPGAPDAPRARAGACAFAPGACASAHVLGLWVKEQLLVVGNTDEIGNAQQHQAMLADRLIRRCWWDHYC